MRIILASIFFLLLFTVGAASQGNGPWNNPLMMAYSTDGVNFGKAVVFQDSAGVPSAIRRGGDTLICVFQWFRQPKDSPTWDRVAVKFSYDDGKSWTEPVPIKINAMTPTYQRPFDPTLALTQDNKIRIYYSSSQGIPAMGMDSTINTYSAISDDGIIYSFEANPRVDRLNNRVIDPAVVQFNNLWHYISPIGAPQDGAYHYISQDGMDFIGVPDIPSDPNHNWTGNFLVESSTELRFYGCGNQNIWYNYSPNGGEWKGYRSTNVQGGDPTLVKLKDGKYLMIFVGKPYPNSIHDDSASGSELRIYPNPAGSDIYIETKSNVKSIQVIIYDYMGILRLEADLNQKTDVSGLPKGVYFVKINGKVFKFLKM